VRDPRKIPEASEDSPGIDPRNAGDLAGIIPESAGDFSGISLRIFRSEEARLENLPPAFGNPVGFVAFQFENSKMGVYAQHRSSHDDANRQEKARFIRCSQHFFIEAYQELASSRRNIFVIRRSRSFPQPRRHTLRQPQPCNRGEHEGHEGHKERIAIRLVPPTPSVFLCVLRDLRVHRA